MSTDWPYPYWIAHRGAGKRAPENTLAAFREGAAQGFRMFECDVKLSADDVPFLLHDSGLERTTSGLGIAGERPWTALSQLDAGSWHDARHAGETIPTRTVVWCAGMCACPLVANLPGEHERGRLSVDQFMRAKSLAQSILDPRCLAHL